MPRRPDTPCAGCGKLIWRGKGVLPAGQATCQPCRAAGLAPRSSRACIICGTEFAPRGSDRKTCSAACFGKRMIQVSATGSEALRKPRPTCEICGAEYRATYGLKQRTCGRKCGAVLNTRIRWVQRRLQAIPLPPVSVGTLAACPECAAPFVQLRAGHSYCSDSCKRSHRRRKDLIRYGKTPEQVDTCARCGGPKAIGARKHCSTCRPLAARDEMRNGRRRRKARERAAKHEPYTLDEIAARDRHLCGLCGKRVAMTQAVPHPKAPTIDHLVPISDGGDDVRANIQLAHFICNSRRGAGGVVQLALVG